MSKQLSLSALFSVAAMALFALSSANGSLDGSAGAAVGHGITEMFAGAPASAKAPAGFVQLP